MAQQIQASLGLLTASGKPHTRLRSKYTGKKPKTRQKTLQQDLP